MPQARTVFVLWACRPLCEGVSEVHLEGCERSGCYGYAGSLDVGLCFFGSRKIDCDSCDAQPGSRVEPDCALTELRLNVSALSDLLSLRPSVSLPSLNISDIPCLLDSSSTHCFIDSSFIEKHKIPTYSIPPILLCLFDGYSSSSISSAIDLCLAFTSGETTSDTFYITSLDSSCMIVLGHCWLARYNPLIDWAMSSITFRPSAAGMPTPTSPSESPELNSVPPPPSSNSLLPSDSPKALGLPCPPISFVNAAAFQRACKLEGSVPFSLSLSSMSAWAAAISNGTPDDPVNLTRVPPEYHDYIDVFSKKKADTLAPHQPFNLKIELEEETEPPIGRLYSLSPSEQGSLRDFLDKHLTNGFIHQSSSPHAASVLFVRKKDGSLCICVDF